MLPMAVEKLAEAKVALERLDGFLNIAEGAEQPRSAPTDNSHAVVMEAASFRWGSSEECLRGVSVTVKKGEVTALIGRVGCGKSSLLAGILGETTLTDGRVESALATDAPIAFVPQQPWIIAGTIRENILMGQPVDAKRYSKVVAACALETDLAAMPAADSTEIGDRGVNLSGGQKLRVNLARAVYQRDAELVLLDDPLSAVDAHVAAHLLDHCIFGLLREERRTVVMATHQLHSLSRCERVVLLESGEVVANGSPEEVATSRHEFGAVLAEVLTTSPSASSKRQQGNADGGDMAQEAGGKEGDAGAEAGGKLVSAEDRAAGRVGKDTYLAYLMAGGGASFALAVCGLSALCQAARVGADVWLAVWAEGVDSNTVASEKLSSIDLTPAAYVGVYALLTALVIPLNIGRTFGFVWGTVRSSRNLHNSMFACVAEGPMLFFEENPLGRILNRFANDLDSIDTLLPWSALAAFQIAFTAFGAVFACVYALPPIALVLPPLFILFRKIQRLYLATSREVKRIEGVSKSPVYALFSVALPGLDCIRAAKLQAHFREEFINRLDCYHRPHFLFLGGSRWVGIRLDGISNVIVLTVCVRCFYRLWRLSFAAICAVAR
eukprot:COSAG04_NODE_3904_length_2436_cov_2.551562_2_plen_610_part_01